MKRRCEKKNALLSAEHIVMLVEIFREANVYKIRVTQRLRSTVNQFASMLRTSESRLCMINPSKYCLLSFGPIISRFSIYPSFPLHKYASGLFEVSEMKNPNIFPCIDLFENSVKIQVHLRRGEICCKFSEREPVVKKFIAHYARRQVSSVLSYDLNRVPRGTYGTEKNV